MNITTCTFLQSIGAPFHIDWMLSERPIWHRSFHTLDSVWPPDCNMSYNPRITPLTINVGPAASYREPGQPHPHQPLQVPQVPHLQPLQQARPAFCQQHVTDRRHNCNKSCLITIFLIICELSITVCRSDFICFPFRCGDYLFVDGGPLVGRGLSSPGIRGWGQSWNGSMSKIL